MQATESNLPTETGLRQQRKDLWKGVWHVTTDPDNNMIQSNDNKEEGPVKPDAKQTHKGTYQNSPSLPSTI